MCPAWQDSNGYWIDEHLMVTARDTQRRYRDNGGEGYRTLSFSCWDCAEIHEGDSWHCPVHQIDFCCKCRGGFGRRYTPALFYDERYLYERAEFANLALDRDVGTGIHLLKDVPMTCLGIPETVTLQQRNQVINAQIEDCRRRAEADGSGYAGLVDSSEERGADWLNISRQRPGEGAYRPSVQDEDWNLKPHLRGLRPANPGIRL